MNCDELQQLTALHALGALEGADVQRLIERLEHDPAARAELARFLDVAGALGASLPTQRPSPSLRTRILERIRLHPQQPSPAKATPPPTSLPPPPPGIQFIYSDAPWAPAPLPGSRFKLLSAGPHQGYAMILIELDPGAFYPEHDHDGVEDMYILTGDLQNEGRSLGPGDFLHAEPGSHHHELRTLNGCTAIMVLPVSSLAALAGA